MIKVRIFILIAIFFITSTVISEELQKQKISHTYEKRSKRNPFIPIITNDGQFVNIQDEDESSSLNLEGVIYDANGQSLAVINGQILRKNDIIADAKIIEIRKDGVIYMKDGEIFMLNTREEKGEE